MQCSCARMINNAKQVVILTVGGIYTTKVELWNSVTLATSVLMASTPMSIGYTVGPITSFMISVNHGRDAICYGGSPGSTYNPSIRAVWKFNLESNNWSFIGNISVGRSEPWIVPVMNIAC